MLIGSLVLVMAWAIMAQSFGIKAATAAVVAGLATLFAVLWANTNHGLDIVEGGIIGTLVLLLVTHSSVKIWGRKPPQKP
jgi:hypothetical protein